MSIESIQQFGDMAGNEYVPYTDSVNNGYSDGIVLAVVALDKRFGADFSQIEADLPWTRLGDPAGPLHKVFA